MPGVMPCSTEKSGDSKDVCIKIINVAVTWTMGEEKLSRGNMTHGRVHGGLTNQGAKKDNGATSTVVQPGYGSNWFLESRRYRGKQFWEPEEQGRRPRQSRLPFGHSHNAAIQCAPG